MADVDVKELLGAYLAGDIRPEERAAVERLLSDDPETRAVLESLKDVLGSVHGADLQVTPAMTRQLRERLAPLLTDEATSAALGSALAGELTGGEQEQLKKYLREHPQEKSRMSAMRDTAQWMKKNQPVATDAMSAALRSRLAAQIPALRGLDSQVSRETTLVRTPALPKSVTVDSAKAGARGTSSLRVVAKDEPWKRRFAWGAAAAAASVALAFGIAKVFESPKAGIAKNGTIPDVAPKQSDPLPNVAPDAPQNEPKVVVEQETPVKGVAPQHTPPEQVVKIDGPQPRDPKLPTPQPEQKIVEREPRVKPFVPEPREARDPFTPKKTQDAPEVVQHEPKTVTPTTPENFVPKTTTPDISVVNRDKQGVAIPTGPSVQPPRPPTDTVATAPTKGSGTTTTLNGGEDVAVGAKTTDTTIKAPTAEVRDALTVVSVKNGSVSAKSDGAEAQTLSTAKTGTQLSSGTEFITSQTSRIILDLPDGRLWVNVSSRVKVFVSGSATTVDLGGGQFAFESSKGSLTVLTSGQTVVTAAKNIDVRLENGGLVAVVLGEKATVKNKKVERGQQATVTNPAGADAPKIGPADNAATTWRNEDEPTLAPANDQPAKGKAKSKSRRL